jgi:hypothetical protein
MSVILYKTATDRYLNTSTSVDINADGYTVGALEQTTWADTRNTVLRTKSINSLSNPEVLAVKKAVLVVNDNTTPTASIGIEADNSGTIGTYFGVNIYNDSNDDFTFTSAVPFSGGVKFQEEGAGASTTNTLIKQGTISLTNTATPITTSFTPTTLFTGNQSMTWADIIAGSGSVGTLNAVLANGNVATGETASITLQDDGLVNSININKAGLTTTTDLTLDIGNDLVLNGDNIVETTAGGFTSNYLKIKINGQYYKLQLLSE